MVARINIDPDLFTRNEWSDLVIRFADREKALGALSWAWFTAQRYWVPEKRPIPHDVWKFQRLNDALIELGFAESREDGIYMKGSEEQFAWLFAKRDAGKKSAESRAQAKVEKARDTTPVVSEGNEAQQVLNVVERLPTSSSSSSSSSVSKKRIKKAKSTSDLPSSEVQEFIGVYIESFQKRYPGARPDLRGPILGQIKRYLSDMPLSRACELIQVFCQMDDDWFAKKAYDFNAFIANQSKIGVALDTGSAPLNTAEPDPLAFLRKDLVVVR